jgi:DNA end-binding protein Ku
MPRPFWNGTLSFGLVTIPVRLVSAVRSTGSPFHLLHDRDHARLAQVMVCPEDDQPVPVEQRTRGWEIEPGRFVPVTDEELDSVAPEASRSIEIEDFVTADAIDPVYYDRPYYLAPSADAGKPYRLLAQILADTGRVGIGRLVMRGREHLAAIRALDGALCLFTLHWAEAVRPRDELAPTASADPDTVQAMTRALEAIAADFDPAAQLRDPMRERLDALVAKKRAAAGTVAAPHAEPAEAEEPGGEPDALLAALKESLAKARGRAPEPAEAAHSEPETR